MEKTKSKTASQTRPKKSSFSDQEYVNLEPNEEDIAVRNDARYLPIDVVRRDLDRWAWGTEGFAFQLFRDLRGNHCIGASIELVIPWMDFNGKVVQRRITGASNFAVTDYAPNTDFVATAKSECIKNAAKELGRKFGRGLNEDMVREEPARETPATRPIPEQVGEDEP